MDTSTWEPSVGHLDKQKALEEGLLAPAKDTMDSWHASESIACQ